MKNSFNPAARRGPNARGRLNLARGGKTRRDPGRTRSRSRPTSCLMSVLQGLARTSLPPLLYLPFPLISEICPLSCEAREQPRRWKSRNYYVTRVPFSFSCRVIELGISNGIYGEPRFFCGRHEVQSINSLERRFKMTARFSAQLFYSVFFF